MSTGATTTRSPAEFEATLQRYLYERSEEARAVRVGEKETSEQAAVVARYGDLFSRAQLDALRVCEEEADGCGRERLYRLRKTCEEGLVVSELAERDDELENALLAARVTFRGEDLPLRSAQAQARRPGRVRARATSSARSRPTSPPPSTPTASS